MAPQDMGDTHITPHHPLWELPVGCVFGRRHGCLSFDRGAPLHHVVLHLLYMGGALISCTCTPSYL